MRKIIIITLAVLFYAKEVSAQIERADIRKGNKLYEKEQYSEAEVEYLRALGRNPASYEGNFNLAGAMFKQGRFQDAQEAFKKSVTDSTRMENLSTALYSLGTAYLAERKLDESIESFKNALKLNPNDTLAKYNLAYAKLLKQKEDQNKDNNQDNKDDKKDQDQNKDQNQDQNKDQNQDDKKDQDNKDNQNDQNQNQDQNQDQNQNQDQQPSEGQMSEEEAEKLLEAMQAAEDKTRENKNGEKKKVLVAPSGKYW